MIINSGLCDQKNLTTKGQNMWKLLKSELDYHKNTIGLFLGIIFLMHLFDTSIAPGNVDFIVALMTFMMINTFINSRAREKRNRLQFKLPISATQLGFSRLLMVYASGAAIVTAIIVGHLLFKSQAQFHFYRTGVLIGSSIFLFVVYFIFSDLFTAFLKKYGRFIMMVLVFVIALIFAFGIVVMRQTNATGSAPMPLLAMINFLKNHNPFTGELGGLVFLILNLLLSTITIFTFNRRKSYAE